VVVSHGSPATHDIVVREMREEDGDVRRLCLQIAIHNNDDLPGSVLKPGVQCGSLAVVSIEVQSANSMILACEAVENETTSIHASIIDEENFKRSVLRLALRRQDSKQLFGEGRKIISLILDRDNDGRPGRGQGGIRQDSPRVRSEHSCGASY